VKSSVVFKNILLVKNLTRMLYHSNRVFLFAHNSRVLLFTSKPTVHLIFLLMCVYVHICH